MFTNYSKQIISEYDKFAIERSQEKEMEKVFWMLCGITVASIVFYGAIIYGVYQLIKLI